MKYIDFNGHKVSRLGLGTAGYDGEFYHPSRNKLLKDGRNALVVIHRAFELGINLIDTAPVYETEWLLGHLSRSLRSEIFISTKSPRSLAVRNGWNTVRARAEKTLEESLRQFGYIDFYFFHNITNGVLTRAQTEGCFTDALRWKEQGKIRFLGISEDFKDASHKMLGNALKTNIFDVVMGVPNLTFPYSSLMGVRSVAMRAGLGKPEGYATALKKMDVVLIGTSSVAHLEEDVRICE